MDDAFQKFVADYCTMREAQRGYFRGKSPTLAQCRKLEAELDKWAAELLRTLKRGGDARPPLTLFDPESPRAS